MFNILRKNSIPKIAKVMPPVLVDKLGKQDSYTSQEVKSVFKQELKYNHNIEYAYAMFCSEQEYRELNLEFNYADLRNQVSKKCFEGWPRFNMDTLLSYSRGAISYQGRTGFADGGISSDDAGCGGGGD